MSEQSYLGSAQLTPNGKGARKGVLNIAHLTLHPDLATAPSGVIHLAVKIN